jgi:hypothetical protein
VDSDARTVAKDRRLLHGRFDIGKAVTIKFKILYQRAMAHTHIEVRM